MASASGNGNPFRPGAGQIPPFLAGREAELASADCRLEELAAGRAPAQGILFYGPRGNGKTVLLESIAGSARRRGMRAERLPPVALRQENRLIEELQERAGLADRRRSGIQLGPVGATAQPAVPTRDPSRLIAAWVGAAPSPLVVMLDEAHTMDPEVGRAFFEAIQMAASDALPVFLIAAGTPDAPRKIRRAGTFAERAFQQLPIGRLDPAATAAALANPASASRRGISDEALALLVAASQDYPYFIQLLGSAAWDVAAGSGEAPIGTRAAADGIEAASVVIERFYMGRFTEAREREIDDVLAPLAALIADRGARAHDSDLKELLLTVARRDSVPYDPASLLTVLTDLGIVWETSSAVWELGIPSFADYIRQRGRKSRSGTG